MMLSAHFALDELTVSQEAVRKGIDNTPHGEQAANLARLAETLETVRSILGKPITVNSAYRSPAVNAAIGGAATSEHCDGRAADIICPAYGSPLMVAKAIEASNLQYNQLIYEGAWVHVSIPKVGQAAKMEKLTARFKNGKATYLKGIQA